MNIIIDGININYRKSGTGQAVILMHGWGQNLEMMYSIENALNNNYTVYNIDLPGFGKSDEPNYAYTISDYVMFLEAFIKTNHIVSPIILGHSFGCRIALKYTALKNDVKSLVLTGAAGIIDKKTMQYYVKVYTFKFFKNFKNVPFIKHYILEMMENAGSVDYRNSSQIMKDVLKNSVNEDLSSYLKDINVPTLLIFGAKDEATPIWMAKVLNQGIINSKLIVYKDRTHYAYLEEQDKFNGDVIDFLKENE